MTHSHYTPVIIIFVEICSKQSTPADNDKFNIKSIYSSTYTYSY